MGDGEPQCYRNLEAIDLSQRPMDCNICKTPFENAIALKAHIRINHQEAVRVTIGNQGVSLEFNQSQSLKELEIVRDQTGRFSCPNDCHFSTHNPQSMHRHAIKKHQNDGTIPDAPSGKQLLYDQVLYEAQQITSLNSTDQEISVFLKASGWLKVVQSVDKEILGALTDTSQSKSESKANYDLILDFFTQNKMQGYSSSLLKGVADTHG